MPEDDRESREPADGEGKGGIPKAKLTYDLGAF